MKLKHKTFVITFGILTIIACSKPKPTHTAFAAVSPTGMIMIKASTYLTENLYTEIADSAIEREFNELISKGAKLDSVDADSNTALLLLAQTADSRFFQKTAALAKILLENKATVNNANYRKFTALHMACLNGNKPLVEVLVANGADIEALDNSSCTPVVYAVTGGGHTAIVELLARHKADLSWKDPTDSLSLLDIAERRGYTKTAEFLKAGVKSK